MNTIKYIEQPKKSYCCGQCCVAMAAGVAIEQVFAIMDKKGSTNTKTIHKALSFYGINCGPKKSLTPIFGNLSKLPHTAILKIKLDWKKSNWHWVLKHGDMILDPGKTGITKINEFIETPGHKITSFLKVSII